MYVKFNSKGMKKFPDGYRVFCHDPSRKMFVPDDYIDEVIKLGGEIVGEPNPEKNGNGAEPVDFDEVFGILISQNDTSNFTVNGVPKIQAVRREMGASVSKEKMLQAWDEYCKANPKPKSEADKEVTGERAVGPETFQGNKDDAPAPVESEGEGEGEAEGEA